MKSLLVVLALLTLDGAKASEFSVRCEARPPSGPYFATFDTTARAVIFETASPNAASADGVSVLTGEISNVGDQVDSKLEFTIRAPDGMVNLTYDSRKTKMNWPGIASGDPVRPTLVHSCVVTPPRSILSFRTSAPILHPISIRCNEAGWMYFTMDLDSKRAIFEREGGRLFQGEITAIRGGDIELQLNGADPGRFLWSSSDRTITFQGIDGKKGTPKQCEEIAPRTMIEFYKRLKSH